MPDERDFEKRLDSLREEATRSGAVTAQGVDVAGGPVPRKRGYYGEPVVKPPVWSWEVPVYFFVGGFGGMASVIAVAALAFHHIDLVRGATWLALIAGVLSPVLLTMDLGRPRRFLNMLRVFKYRSPMSVGAWIVAFFGINSVPALIAVELWQRHIFSGALANVIGVVAVALLIGAAFFGMLLSTYTGVLLGVTTIPVWFLHRVLLPIHFGTAGLGSAAGLLELFGFHARPIFLLGASAAIVETVLWIALELDRHGPADRALFENRAGWLIRTSEFLSGPLALIFRATNLIPLSALSFLCGAFVSRFGWIEAGQVSARDPEAVFASQK
jgi:hypothetical protein